MSNQNTQAPSVLPSPQSSFRVQWGDVDMFFQEASGLPTQGEGHSNITLRKGIINDDDLSVSLRTEIAKGAFKRIDMSIRLLDETGQTVVTWSLKNAFISKVSMAHAQSEHLAIETIEVASERIKILQ
ncbi:MAG: phage tail protein [Sphingobacteriales bacterium]|nr:MAG: phage tail protein [Sphingobacteriales bacterium]